MSWTRIEVLGRVLAEPDMKYGQSGKPWLRLFVGCGTQKNPCNIDVVAFGELAEQCTQIRKGEDIAIIGNLRMDEWDDRDTGKKRKAHKIVASKISSASRFSHEMREEIASYQERNQGAPQRPSGAPESYPNEVPF